MLGFVISFLASVVGSICGIGGGVIIKPLLDSTGLLDVKTVSFLSGCTVLSMSVISVLTTAINSKKSGEHILEIREVTFLAIGAGIGGVTGKELFIQLSRVLEDISLVGAIQATVLILLTLGTMLYTINSRKITSHTISNRFWCLIIGLVLGMFSAFLGIGGGPINLVVLAYFFSMSLKKAAVNSLYIIMFSQLTSLGKTLLTGVIPEFEISMLILMVLGGVLGALVGKKSSGYISSIWAHKLFISLMCIIIGINIYNLIKFL